MKPEEGRLLISVAAAARELPRSVVEELCEALEDLPDDAAQQQHASLAEIVPLPNARALIYSLLEAWANSPYVSPANLAWGLRAASEVDEHHRHAQSIELVWTGPAPKGTLLRRTDQVLLDLIRSTRSTLYLVTFAAYKVPIITEAMLEAARRGVEISLIFESPDVGKTAFAAIKAVGDELEALSSVYVWPFDKRPRDAKDGYGSLHAKCAVADGSVALISSANLTEYALTLNMELGLLVRGGALPGQVTSHLRRLIEAEILTPL